MKNCIQCGQNIPNRILIDGKIRITNKRKLCLDCSPFGLHNTSKNPKNKVSRKAKRIFVCNQCNKEKNERGRYLTCHTCRSNKQRRVKKEKAVSLFGGKCSSCGYSKSIKALEFHHKENETKLFGLAMAWNKSWEIIEKELKKCELLCSNCHKELHGDVT